MMRSESWQTWIVTSVVLGAVAYLIRRGWQAVQHPQQAGCGACTAPGSSIGSMKPFVSSDSLSASRPKQL